MTKIHLAAVLTLMLSGVVACAQETSDDNGSGQEVEPADVDPKEQEKDAPTGSVDTDPAPRLFRPKCTPWCCPGDPTDPICG